MDNSGKPIKKIVVLGGGTAGFLAAITIAKKLPEVELVVIRSKKIGVIGVGEGTIPSVVQFLHGFLDFDLHAFNKAVHPSIKLGIHYLWGPRPFFNYTFSPQVSQPHPGFSIAKGYFCQDDFEFADMNSALMYHDKVCVRDPDGKPRFNRSFAYHLENERLVNFLEEVADQLKIKKIDAIMENAELGPQGVEALILDNGQRIDGDLFIDCSGLRAELIGKALKEQYVDFSDKLYCDRAAIGAWQRTDEDVYHPYTTAETMDAGWAWQIEHDNSVNRGYVFSSQFLSNDQAVEEFCRKNPKIDSPQVIEFRAGVYKRTWVKNVVAVGMAAGFVEPIEATQIGVICDSISRLVRGLSVSNLRLLDVQRTIFNRIVFKNWEIIRDFIGVHYKFNSRLDTPFWEYCQREVDLGDAQELVDYYKEVGPDFAFFSVELKRDFFTAEGYLAMLVGQQVPYQRKVDLNDSVTHKWKSFKKNLAAAASQGVEMREYLQLLREPEMVDTSVMPNSAPGKAPYPVASGAAEAIRTGELNWH